MASLVSQPQMETSRLYMNSWQCESRKAYTFGRSPVRPVRADGTIEVKLNFETHVGCIDSACAVYGEAQCPQDQILFVTIYTPHIWTRFMENQSLRRSGGTFALVFAQIQLNSESAGNGLRNFEESK